MHFPLQAAVKYTWMVHVISTCLQERTGTDPRFFSGCCRINGACPQNVAI